jgi:hypothetical protein
MKGNTMNEVEAIRNNFIARVLPKLELVAVRKHKRDLNAELYAQMDDEGAFDEPWWLDYQ